jgi:hypothetical protein
VRREQASLREIMWPPDSAPPDIPPAGGLPGEGPGNGDGPKDGAPESGAPRGWAGSTAGDRAGDERAHNQTGEQAAAPYARVAPVDGPVAEAVPVATPRSAVPVPISRLPELSGRAGEEMSVPIPGHLPVDDRYQWYTVHRRKDSHLSEFVEGTWLLVNRDAPPPDERALVIVSSREPAIGSVLVRSNPAQDGAPLCFLGYYHPGQDEPSLVLDESGKALRIPHVLLLGVVIGAWHAILV